MEFQVSSKFIVTKIKRNSGNEIALTVKIDGVQKKFKIDFISNGLVSLPTELEFILRGNDIALSKTFLQMLQNFQNEVEILTPFVVFEKLKSGKEKIAA
jgi:hypothetical protein